MFSLASIIDGWNYFFHEPQTAEALGGFRIVWGTLLTLNALCMFPFAKMYFSPTGIFPTPRFLAHFGRGRFTLFNILPDTYRMAQWILGINLAASVFLTCGVFTRFSAFVVFITLLSLQHRTVAVVHSGDTVLRFLTFLMIFANAGDTYSVDALLAEQPIAPKSPWAWRLMQLQICIIYVRTVFWKLRGKKWLDGTAAYFPTQLVAFRRLPLPRFLATAPLIALASWGTLATQVALGSLVWVDEFRYPVLLLGIGMHLTLDLLLELQLFSWTMVSSYLLFVPSAHLKAVLAWVEKAFANLLIV